MQIKVRINEEGALRNQRYAFTDRFTLISELLQNARRAGATQIEVEHDSDTQVLCVRDDGCGMADFQKLLSFHESGWDATTCTEERPFGVGFSKCLYAASRCIVASGLQRVDIDTAAALGQASFEVTQLEPAKAIHGTLIELHGVDLPDLAARIDTLCLGFPTAVLFNGKPLQRRLAQAHLPMMPSPIGAVYLTGTQDCKHNHHTLVFLQGFCVMRPPYWSVDQVNVVHLDSQQFVARLPDRDKLIDEDLQRERIETALKACWRTVLEAAKARMPPERFVEDYYSAMRSWGHLDLLNDIFALPRVLCSNIVAYPTQDNSGGVEYLQQVTTAPSRHALEAGAATLSALDLLDDENAALWLFSQAKGHLVFDWLGLHTDHWVQPFVRFPERESVAIEVVSEQHKTELEGRWIWPTVILCERIRITVDNESADITQSGLHHEGCLYIPEGETSGEPVRQASSFMDEHDQYLANDMEADRDALADLICRLRSVDPLQTLDSLLQNLKLGKYPLLHGKRFALTVGTGPAPSHSLDLLD